MTSANRPLSCSVGPRPARTRLAAPLLGALTLTSLPMLGGCGPEKGPGSLAVTYVLGNAKTCDELGIETVELELIRGSGDDREVLYDDRGPCGDDLLIEGIEAKTYEVEVTAFDGNGIATLDNLADSESERRIEIFEASDATLEVDLTSRPAELFVRWRLGADGFADCDGVGIDAFEVRAFEEDGGNLLLEDVLSCGLDGDGAGNWRLLADPERDLTGSLFGEVGITPLDANGDAVGGAATFEFDPVGAGYPVQLSIECDELGCVPDPG